MENIEGQPTSAGHSYSFSTQPPKVEGGQISEIPLVAMGDEGELAVGTILNKYLPIPQLSKENKLVQEELQRLVSSLKERKNLDKSRLPEKKLSFEYFHYASNQMPQWVKRDLRSLD